MIQRKQSIHLLLITGLLLAMLFMPLATINIGGSKPSETISTGEDGTITRTTIVQESNIELNVWGIYSDGVKDVPLVFMTILVFAAIAVSFFSIFLYKRRALQLRLCFVLGILLVGLIAYIGLYLYQLNGAAATQEFSAIKYSVSDLFPVLALVLVWFAYRGVASDISLIRSLDRIR